jgi:hypothetical protein
MDDFQKMVKMADSIEKAATMMVYCDHIAALARRALTHSYDGLLSNISPVQHDEEDGRLVSHRKTIEITDVNGRKYRLTVEEV